MKKLSLLLLLLIAMLTSCSDTDKADKLRLELKYDEAAALYRKAADNGDAYAMWRLAECYSNGNGIEFDKKKAYDWIVKSAKAGQEEAKVDLALTKIDGLYGQPKNVKEGIKEMEALYSSSNNAYTYLKYAGLFWDGVQGEIEKDRSKAVEIINKLEDKNSPYYNWFMGIVYCTGTDDIDIDENKAIEFWNKSFSEGFYGSLQIANLYANGGSQIEKNIDKAIEFYKKGVETNGTGSMLHLANLYLSPDSSLQKYHNPKAALELLKKAVKHGGADACDRLGCMYSFGENVEKDDEQAVKYFKLADEYGSSNGTLNLGAGYHTGRGVEQDLKKAEACYQKAADRGNHEAAMRLAESYANHTFGYDLTKYKEYLNKAVKLGSPRATYKMAELYYHGYSDLNIKQDVFQAFVYAKKAADAGWIDACEMVSYLYENGIGCDKDIAKAKEYHNKASM